MRRDVAGRRRRGPSLAGLVSPLMAATGGATSAGRCPGRHWLHALGISGRGRDVVGRSRCIGAPRSVILGRSRCFVGRCRDVVAQMPPRRHERVRCPGVVQLDVAASRARCLGVGARRPGRIAAPRSRGVGSGSTPGHRGVLAGDIVARRPGISGVRPRRRGTMYPGVAPATSGHRGTMLRRGAPTSEPRGPMPQRGASASGRRGPMPRRGASTAGSRASTPQHGLVAGPTARPRGTTSSRAAARRPGPRAPRRRAVMARRPRGHSWDRRRGPRGTASRTPISAETRMMCLRRASNGPRATWDASHRFHPAARTLS